jgi:putative endonuclease
MTRGGCAYILGSNSLVLYVGVTSDLVTRVLQHKIGAYRGFASRYSVDKLLYYDCSDSIAAAIAREKQIKGWRRQRKIELIAAMNPTFDDLAAAWFTAGDLAAARASLRGR